MATIINPVAAATTRPVDFAGCSGAASTNPSPIICSKLYIIPFKLLLSLSIWANLSLVNVKTACPPSDIRRVINQGSLFGLPKLDSLQH